MDYARILRLWLLACAIALVTIILLTIVGVFPIGKSDVTFVEALQAAVVSPIVFFLASAPLAILATAIFVRATRDHPEVLGLGRCIYCRYDLSRVDGLHCPECGKRIAGK